MEPTIQESMKQVFFTCAPYIVTINDPPIAQVFSTCAFFISSIKYI